MSAQITLDKMKQMRLLGMEQAYYATMQTNSHHELTTDEYIAHLIEAEWADRQNRKVDRLIANARFRYPAQVSDIDYRASRALDKNAFIRLTELDFIKQRENVIITGPTGVGKSYLASALGHQACMLGYRTLYANTARLFSLLKMARADASYDKQIRKVAKTDLLILDDFGLHPLEQNARQILMEIIDDRYDKAATIICGQVPVANWYDIIGEGTIADAILDRVVHASHRIELKGESMRKKKKNQ